jgi:hypothetical protein
MSLVPAPHGPLRSLRSSGNGLLGGRHAAILPRLLTTGLDDVPNGPFLRALLWGIGRALVHFQTEGELTPSPRLLCDDRLTTDGVRASGHQHPIQHRHADGSLSLLSRKAAGSQPWSNQ